MTKWIFMKEWLMCNFKYDLIMVFDFEPAPFPFPHPSQKLLLV